MCIRTQQHVANMVAKETCGRNMACTRYKWRSSLFHVDSKTLISFLKRWQHLPPEPLSTRYNLPKQTSRLLPCSWCNRYDITFGPYLLALHASHTYHLRTANQHFWVHSSYSSSSETRFYPKSHILDTEWVHYSWISNLWPVCKPFNWIILWLPGINWFSVHKVKKQVNKLRLRSKSGPTHALNSLAPQSQGSFTCTNESLREKTVKHSLGTRQVSFLVLGEWWRSQL